MFTAATVQPTPIRPAELPSAYEHWWYEGDRRAYKDNQRLSVLANAASHHTCVNLAVVMDCYERETLEQVCGYYAHCPTTKIIVLRNIFNTIASMIKRRPEAPFFDIDVWKSLARQAVRGSGHECEVILFDKWHGDAGYRESIARRMGVKFTDEGRNEILNIGRGSSFDATGFDGKAENMDVLNRYKDILGHPTVRRKVLSDSEAVELNETLFGNCMSNDR